MVRHFRHTDNNIAHPVFYKYIVLEMAVPLIIHAKSLTLMLDLHHSSLLSHSSAEHTAWLLKPTTAHLLPNSAV